jgi:hypothetical protein
VLLIAVGCGAAPNVGTSSPTPDAATATNIPLPRVLSSAELSRINAAFDYPYENPELAAFLTCQYNSPEEIDPNAVFYSGAGGFVETIAEQRDYLASHGYRMPADWRDFVLADGTLEDMGAYLLPLATVDDILQRRLGITLEQATKAFDFGNYANGTVEAWVDTYNAYFARCTDTNLPDAQCVSGEYLGGDTYAVDYSTASETSNGGYRMTFTMTDDDPNTIVFISNVAV